MIPDTNPSSGPIKPRSILPGYIKQCASTKSWIYSTEQYTMSVNNPSWTHEQADRAIMAMYLLRAGRLPGDYQKGIGANRDDHPLFTQLVTAWMQDQPVPKDLLFQCRARVLKYHRQLRKSKYYQDIIDARGMTTLQSMFLAAKPDIERAAAERQLHEVLQAKTNYGTW